MAFEDPFQLELLCDSMISKLPQVCTSIYWDSAKIFYASEIQNKILFDLLKTQCAKTARKHNLAIPLNFKDQFIQD